MVHGGGGRGRYRALWNHRHNSRQLGVEGLSRRERSWQTEKTYGVTKEENYMERKLFTGHFLPVSVLATMHHRYTS